PLDVVGRHAPAHLPVLPDSLHAGRRLLQPEEREMVRPGRAVPLLLMEIGMRAKRVLGSALASLVLRAAAAAAHTADGTPHRTWQISLFGGGWNAIGSTYLYRTPSGTAEVEYGNAPTFGVSAGLDVSRLAGLELSWTQTSPAQQYVTAPPTPIRSVTL